MTNKIVENMPALAISAESYPCLMVLKTYRAELHSGRNTDE